jgi:hypothetical protein
MLKGFVALDDLREACLCKCPTESLSSSAPGLVEWADPLPTARTLSKCTPLRT